MAAKTRNRTWGVLRLLALFVAILCWLYFAQPIFVEWCIGAGFAALGVLLRLWTAGHLTKTTLLITSGPYRYLRNPMYLGRLFIFIGLAIASRLPHGLHFVALGLGLLIFFVYYMPRKERVEPARLLTMHGKAYEVYYKEVPSLLPRLAAWPKADRAPWQTTKLIRNRELWMTIGVSASFFWLWLKIPL